MTTIPHTCGILHVARYIVHVCGSLSIHVSCAVGSRGGPLLSPSVVLREMQGLQCQYAYTVHVCGYSLISVM